MYYTYCTRKRGKREEGGGREIYILYFAVQNNRREYPNTHIDRTVHVSGYSPDMGESNI